MPEKSAPADYQFLELAEELPMLDWHGISRRFASILMRSSRPTSKRSDIVYIEGFRLRRRTVLALPQST